MFVRAYSSLIVAILIIGVLTGGGFVMGKIFAENTNNITQYETTIFTTVLTRDIDSSVEEKETAAHFFAEAILGWTLSPYFSENLGFSISSKKQERGNIIFQFTSASQEESRERVKKFELLITKKLETYNQNAQTQFALLSDPAQTKEKMLQQNMWSVIGAAIGFFLGLITLEILRFFRRNEVKN